MGDRCDVLVVGGDGLIGRALVRRIARSGATGVHTSRRGVPGALALDLACTPEGWTPLPSAATVVLAAAVSTLAGCAAAPAASARINVAATLALAHLAASRGAHVVLLSSNQVFDGSVPHRRRHDAPCPISQYGRQKAAAERCILALGARGSVLRLTKVIDRAAAPPQGWIADLAAGQPVRHFCDFTVAPVAIGFVLDVIERLIAARVGGLFHASGAEDVTYAAVAAALVCAEHARSDLLCPRALTAPPPGLTAIPRYTSLEMDETTACFGLAPPILAATLAHALAA